MEIHGHPFSSYTQKVMIPLYENGTEFDFHLLDREQLQSMDKLRAHWPIAKFPVLFEGDRTVMESTVIIEYLQAFHPGPEQMIPDDPGAAIEARMMDRVFDNYVMTPMMHIVIESMRPGDARDPLGVEQSCKMLDTVYEWLDERLAGQEWAAGDAFTLADCAAAPSLFYADWVREIPEQYATLRAYRAKLLARPSVARCVDEARPYRHYFPLGAPDRD